MATEADTVRIPTTRPEPRPVDAGATAARSRSRRLVLLVALAVLAAAGVVGWRRFFVAAAPTGIITVSGRIEGDDSVVAPRTAGRILELRVHEGDSVQAGDTLAVLDDEHDCLAKVRVEQLRHRHQERRRQRRVSGRSSSQGGWEYCLTADEPLYNTTHADYPQIVLLRDWK